jgi:hypothetical protein
LLQKFALPLLNGKGKRTGARIITYFVIEEETIFLLLSIYDKSEQATMNNKDMNELLKHLS